MSTYRALDGFFSFGGKLAATVGPLVNGALTIGVTTLNLDGTALAGVVMPGDKFTIAGESGSPQHTVTGSSPYVAAGNAITGLTFIPGIATGGVADNAAITFVNNSVAECKAHGMKSNINLIDDSVMGDLWKTFVAEQAEWEGNIDVHLDYGDPVQKLIIDDLLIAAPSVVVPGVLFGIASKKQFYGGCLLSGVEISGGVGTLFTAKFTMKGSGPARTDWN